MDLLSRVARRAQAQAITLAHLENKGMTICYISYSITLFLLWYLLQEAMDKSLCNRIYITRVLADFDCDTFFPKIDDKLYQQIS